jgi:ABC-type microcin C transport system permease subunit YejB
MKVRLTRKHLSMAFSVLGIGLMGVDLLITRNFFTHIGELMALSIFCLVLGIVLDRASDEGKGPKEQPPAGKTA